MMLEIKGPMSSSEEAIEFMENIEKVIPKEDRTLEIYETFERVLNRFRYNTAKDVGTPQIKSKSIIEGYGNIRCCGKCGTIVHELSYYYCPHCGTRYQPPVEK